LPLRVRLAAVLSALALSCAGGALLPAAVGHDAAVAASCQTQHNSVHVQLSSSRYPETTDHIADAIAAGQPSLLHIDRADEDAHRAASLADYPPRANLDRDEYSPAIRDAEMAASARCREAVALALRRRDGLARPQATRPRATVRA
jgi:hypothetical protein